MRICAICVSINISKKHRQKQSKSERKVTKVHLYSNQTSRLMDRIYSINVHILYVRLLFWFQVQFAFSRSVFSPQFFPNHDDDDDVIVSLIESMSRCSISMLSSCCRWSLKLHGSRGGKPVQLIHSQLLVLCSLVNTYAVLMPCVQITQSTLTDIHIIFVLQAVQIVIYLYSSILYRIISLYTCSIEVCFLWSESGEG